MIVLNKKIILISICIISLLSLSAVCAADNDNSSISSVVDDSCDLTLEVDNQKDVLSTDDDDYEDDNWDLDDDEGDDDYDVGIPMDYTVEFPSEMFQGRNESLTIIMPNDTTGTLEVDLGDGSNPVEVVNGIAKVSLKKLDVGLNFVYVYFSDDDKYEDWNGDYDIQVYELLRMKVTAPSQAYVNTSTKITFTGPEDYYGDITVYVNGKKYYGEFDEGEGVVYIKSSNLGTITCTYRFDEISDEATARGNFTVKFIEKPKIQASGLTMFSSENKYYKVRILNSKGKSIGAGKSVTFYLSGKKLATVKTDKNGYAKVKISSRKAGTYKIKTTYQYLTVTNTLKVKYVLKDYTSTKKSNVNSITFKIGTNKVGGKYYKGKVVSFKLNGKTYKAKINSKGVAQLTLKKSAFAKFKVGKYYELKTIFGKDIRSLGFKLVKIKPKLSYRTGIYAVYSDAQLGGRGGA